MRPHHRQTVSRNLFRRGFTLVEMMVAMALVLLMMVMFAEIFTLATGSMSKQKSLSELDQRQRTVSTILRNDLQDRTFFNLTPFHKANSALSLTDPNFINPALRSGYFYISENDLDNDVDDVLQFTVLRKVGKLFYGRTKELLANGPPSGTIQNPNQPESDDGMFANGIPGAQNNNAGASPEAEIAYFVRNGILYRRILLIRNPLGSVEQPMSTPIGGMMPIPSFRMFRPGIYPGSYVNGGTNFLNDFDYSATYDFASKQIELLAHSRLANTSSFDPFALGLSNNRFGFNPLSGNPLEYMISSVPGDPLNFLGRFTHEETSHIQFGWPGDPGPNQGPDGAFLTMDDTFGSGSDTNPYTRPNLALSPDGVVINTTTGNPAYQGGPRQGEDMLLTNVIGFDIKVWDPRGGPGRDGQPGIAGVNDDGANGVDDPFGELGSPNSDDGAFVDIGNNGRFGFYSQSNNWNANFGPRGPANNRCFDTWQPNKGGLAPFVYHPGIDQQPGVANVDDDGDGTIDNAPELGWGGSDDIPIPQLKAIQIRVRYRDITSNLVREFTVVEQLTTQTNLSNTN
ncbi:MAG: Verru Chthon cassette protein [Planctomycetaceae bacterium]|nr:Verru Chthon cassette protein [Planctomycetaceae bacterium]